MTKKRQHPFKALLTPKKKKRKLKLVFVSIGLSLLSLAFSVLLPIWRLFPDIQNQPAVPLHYNIHFGVDSLGPWWRIFVYPAFGLAVLILNTILAMTIFKKDRVLRNLLLITSIAANIVIAIAMVFVVLVNLTYA